MSKYNYLLIFASACFGSVCYITVNLLKLINKKYLKNDDQEPQKNSNLFVIINNLSEKQLRQIDIPSTNENYTQLINSDNENFPVIPRKITEDLKRIISIEENVMDILTNLRDNICVGKKQIKAISDNSTNLVTDLPIIKCSVCKRNIAGVFFKCLVCFEYYLCISCEKNDSHPHDLLKQREVKNEKQDLRCIVCNKSIIDIIFSCTVCTNYSLCRICEENSDHHHDMTKRRLTKNFNAAKKSG